MFLIIILSSSSSSYSSSSSSPTPLLFYSSYFFLPSLFFRLFFASSIFLTPILLVLLILFHTPLHLRVLPYCYQLSPVRGPLQLPIQPPGRNIPYERLVSMTVRCREGPRWEVLC